MALRPATRTRRALRDGASVGKESETEAVRNARPAYDETAAWTDMRELTDWAEWYVRNGTGNTFVPGSG
jgi:hypothetical protein